MNHIYSYFSPNVLQLLLVLGLSFLIGLEREEEKSSRPASYFFGGVRTFPLIALIGYSLVILAPEQTFLFGVGFLVLGFLLGLSYWSKIEERQGVTSEMSGLITFLIGGLIAKEMYWMAIAVAITNLLLLQLKTYLENFAKQIHSEEITTFVKFLLLSVVILPIIPNVELTQFQINPYKTWLIVVAVSSIFYASYLMEKVMKVRESVLLSGVIGGLYSSTATTVVLAKKAKGSKNTRSFSGSILIATAMMYLRLSFLLYIFNRQLFSTLGIWFVKLGVIAAVGGFLWARFGESREAKTPKKGEVVVSVRNPLEVRTALMFAVLFLLLLIATRLATEYFGNSGVFSLAALMGFVDVDPFILGLTQTGGVVTPINVAAFAILIASATNNFAKGIYSIIFAGKKTGIEALCLLSIMSVISMLIGPGLF